MTYIGSKDLMLEIPAGNVSGWLSVNKFGRNNLSADDVPEDLWLSGNTYPVSATTDGTGTLALISHVKQLPDVAANRGGLIQVQGLDVDWNLTLQTINLDAADSSTLTGLTTPLRRVFRVYSEQSATLGAQVNVVNSGDTELFAVVAAGINQTQMAIYTVPSGYTAYMTNYYGAYVPTTTPPRNPQSTTFSIITNDNENDYFRRLRHESSTSQGNSHFQHFFKPYYKFNQLVDIHIETVCQSNAGVVNGGFDLILVPN